MLESALSTVASEATHRPLVESVDAAKRNMLLFARLLTDIEKATFEACSWMVDFVPLEEVLHPLVSVCLCVSLHLPVFVDGRFCTVGRGDGLPCVCLCLSV